MSSKTNGFFKYSDKRSEIVAGMKLPEQWWSRPYEYGWALGHAEASQVAADMGTGWMYRPFKDALAEICGFVYAVDLDVRLMQQQPADNMQFVIASITQPIKQIEAASLDRIFCISVLEDMGDMIGDAVAEFARLLKPDGRMILTFDVQYDMDKPLGQYPGVALGKFLNSLDENGLVIDGELVLDKKNAVYHEGFNLCCLHTVVKNA
jgi:SAM-dependent methyltransferase